MEFTEEELEYFRRGESEELIEERGKRLDQQCREILESEEIEDQEKSAFLRFAIKDADPEKFSEVKDKLGRGNI